MRALVSSNADNRGCGKKNKNEKRVQDYLIHTLPRIKKTKQKKTKNNAATDKGKHKLIQVTREIILVSINLQNTIVRTSD